MSCVDKAVGVEDVFAKFARRHDRGRLVDSGETQPFQGARRRAQITAKGDELERDFDSFTFGRRAEERLRLGEGHGIEPELLADLAFGGRATPDALPGTS